MPTIKVFKDNNLFTPIHTVFVKNDDTDRWHADPVILEEDGECVIFSSWEGAPEMVGTAVHSSCLTVEEAFEIAKLYGYTVSINNRWFGTDRADRFCAGFVKKRGSRIWLLPVSLDDAGELVKGSKKIIYYTYNRGAEVVAA